jgi:hypothetical protein
MPFDVALPEAKSNDHADGKGEDGRDVCMR